MSTTPLEADFAAGHGRDVPEDAGLYRTQLESPVRGSPGGSTGAAAFCSRRYAARGHAVRPQGAGAACRIGSCRAP